MTSERPARDTAWRISLAALMVTGLIGWLDHLLGVSVTLAPFYLLPIAAVAWYGRPWQGAGLGLISTAASLLGDITSRPAVEGFTPYWNATVRLPVLVGMALLVARLRDLVERERAAAELNRRAAEAMRAANDMKTAFVRAVAHDLRGPVTAIVGGATSLEAMGEELNDADRRGLIESLARGARRLKRLIGDLLDLERLETQGPTLVFEAVDVEQTLNQVVEDSGLRRDHPVIVHADGVVATVDRVMLERIVFNLMANAAKHLHEDVPVWVDAKLHDQTLLLTVEDAGPGVPDAMKARIFEAFERGEAQAVAGVGIGLSLVARFAELHGGRAWVEDRTGGGASFRVQLLQGQAPAAEHLGEESTPAAPHNEQNDS